MKDQASKDTQPKINVKNKQKMEFKENIHRDKSSFMHGLLVGLGAGSMTVFIVLWIAIFFTPKISSTVTYETMLSIFIYPLIYLLAVGLIALTAGIVKEYTARKILKQKL